MSDLVRDGQPRTVAVLVAVTGDGYFHVPVTGGQLSGTDPVAGPVGYPVAVAVPDHGAERLDYQPGSDSVRFRERFQPGKRRVNSDGAAACERVVTRDRPGGAASLASMQSPVPPPVPSPVPGAGPPVFLVAPGALPASLLTLSGPEGHHAAAVRRLRAGERADVSDGAGTLAECTVVSVSRDSVVLSVRSVRVVPSPEPRITVVQALPKGDRAEQAVELMTEVGVDAVVAWAAERSVTRWHGERGERALGKWRATAREAAKQSRRPWLPEVTGPAGLSDVATLVSQAACAVVLEAGAATPLSALAMPEAGSVVVVVGPEGGISPAERAALTSAGAIQARLGPTVLRTSTAGAAAAAVLLARTGRW